MTDRMTFMKALLLYDETQEGQDLPDLAILMNQRDDDTSCSERLMTGTRSNWCCISFEN